MGVRVAVQHARGYPIASAPWPFHQHRSIVRSPSLRPL